MSKAYGKKILHTLFDERVRRESPASSYKRADELDRSVKLTKQMLTVLRFVKQYAGKTAQELGVIMMRVLGVEWFETPHKTISRMEQAGWVRREMPANERAYKCYITESGKAVLKMEHTKGKWKASGRSNYYNIHVAGVQIARTEHEANARRICKCVNGYDGLVEALKKAQKQLNYMLRNVEDDTQIPYEVLVPIKQALEEAENEV